jgi:hypothetical protein
MTKFLLSFLGVSGLLMTLTACHHDSLEDRAEKETKDYTARYCPTPVQNFQMTDSISFTRATKTLNYYYKFADKADDEKLIAEAKPKLLKLLIAQLKEDTKLKAYKDAGYHFHYVYRSRKSGKVVLEATLGPKEYR